MDFLFNRSSCKIQNETSPAEAAVSSSPEFSLWQDKYQPTNAKDVAAHTSKKKAVREWIIKSKEKYLYQKSLSENSPNFRPSVLVLCGCSGTCKSTMVEVIAKELDVPVVEWHEDLIEGKSEVAFNPFLTAREYAQDKIFSTSRGQAARELLREELQDFAVRSAYSSLTLCSSNSRAPPGHIHALNDPPPAALLSKKGGVGKKRKLLHSIVRLDQESDGLEDDIADFDDDSDDFSTKLPSKYHSSRHFLHRTDTVRSSSCSSSCSSDLGASSESSHHIVLIHDPSSLLPSYSSPDDSTPSGRRRGGEGVYSQLHAFQHPVVLILSGVGDRDAMFWAVNDLIPKELDGSLDLEVVYCTPITILQTKKVLRKIAEKECREGAALRGEEGWKMEVPPDSLLEAIATTALGDLRQAIAQLQMHMLGDPIHLSPALVTDSSSGGFEDGCEKRGAEVWADPEAGARDKAYSFLHGVGKLLWASVYTKEDEGDEEPPPLSDKQVALLYKLKFPPDCVIRRLELPLDKAMSFLQYNYPAILQQAEVRHLQCPSAVRNPDPSLPSPSYDFLERAERLSEIFSEADMLHACQFSTNLPIDRAESSSFPTEYVESICCRASACSMYPTSKTPALFHSILDSSLRRDRDLAEEEEHNDAFRNAYDHLTGTSGGPGVKKSTSSSGKGYGSSMVPIRRPASLDVRIQAATVATMTRDLRTALISHPPACSRSGKSLSPPLVHSRTAPAASPVSVQPFDYVAKQVARSQGCSNSSTDLRKRGPGANKVSNSSGTVEEQEQEQEGCLPVSFLSSTELITVVVPYLKCLLAMNNQPSLSSFLMHPDVQRHITALMGVRPVVEHRAGKASCDKPSVLLGREEGRRSVPPRQGQGGGVMDWALQEDLEEFSD